MCHVNTMPHRFSGERKKKKKELGTVILGSKVDNKRPETMRSHYIFCF